MRKTATPKEVAAFLVRHNFVLVRQRGSHALYRHTDGRWTVVPLHNRDLAKSTLCGILNRAGFTLQDMK